MQSLVLREANKAEQRGSSAQSFKQELARQQTDCIEDAKQHLEMVAGLAPSQQDWDAARRRRSMERECHWLVADIRADLIDVGLEEKEPQIRIEAAGLKRDKSLETLAGYDVQRLERLKAWLKANRGKVRVEDDGLVIRAEQAILTIIARHQDAKEVRDLLSLVVVDRLIKEARENRWRIREIGGLFRWSDEKLAGRQLEMDLLAALLERPLVQKALKQASDQQAREIEGVVEATASAQWSQAAGKLILVNDAFARLSEYILSWRDEKDIIDAVARRRDERKRKAAD